jgi:hypothetical protein
VLPTGKPHHDANVRFCAPSARSSLLGGARDGGSGASCQRSPPRPVITVAVARQCEQPLAGCTASGDAEGQAFAASRCAMALRGQLRGDAEGGPAAEVLAREHGPVNRPGVPDVFST